jgi:hypothetical protein
MIKQVFTIVLKDLKQYWLLTAVLCTLLVLLTLAQAGVITTSGGAGGDLIGALPAVLYWGVLLFVFVPLIVQSDCASSPSAFWHTRPISALTLATAKLSLIIIVGSLLPAALEVANLIARGLNFTYAARAFAESSLDGLLPLLPVALIAASASSLSRFARITAAAFLILCITASYGWLILRLTYWSYGWDPETIYHSSTRSIIQEIVLERYRFLCSNLFLSITSVFIFLLAYQKKLSRLSLALFTVCLLFYLPLVYGLIPLPFTADPAKDISLAEHITKAEIEIRKEGNAKYRGQVTIQSDFKPKNGFIAANPFPSSGLLDCILAKDLRAWLEAVQEQQFYIPDYACENSDGLLTAKGLATFRKITSDTGWHISINRLRILYSLPLETRAEHDDYLSNARILYGDGSGETDIAIEENWFDLALDPAEVPQIPYHTRPLVSSKTNRFFVLINAKAGEAIPLFTSYGVRWGNSYQTAVGVNPRYGPAEDIFGFLPIASLLSRTRIHTTVFKLHPTTRNSSSLLPVGWLKEARVLGVEISLYDKVKVPMNVRTTAE